MEKRRASRVSLMAELTYQVDGIAITKRVTDISEGGMFIDTPVPSDVGTTLKMQFVLEGEMIQTEGRVVYSQPYIGMGVAFTRISERHRDVIRKFVARLATAEPAVATVS